MFPQFLVLSSQDKNLKSCVNIYTLEILIRFCFVFGKCIYGFILCVFQVFCETKSGIAEPWEQRSSARPRDFGRQINYLNQRGQIMVPPIFRPSLSYGPAK